MNSANRAYAAHPNTIRVSIPKSLEQRRREALEEIHRIALLFEQEGNSRQRKAALKTIANLSRAVV